MVTVLCPQPDTTWLMQRGTCVWTPHQQIPRYVHKQDLSSPGTIVDFAGDDGEGEADCQQQPGKGESPSKCI